MNPEKLKIHLSMLGYKDIHLEYITFTWAIQKNTNVLSIDLSTNSVTICTGLMKGGKNLINALHSFYEPGLTNDEIFKIAVSAHKEEINGKLIHKALKR